jgi:hypothetical protein
MSAVYAMQRANGDVFALDHKGQFRIPLFHTSRDAMTARSRNLDMLLFKPVMLNAGLLLELVPRGEGNDVELWLVKDPSISLKHGRVVEHEQLLSLLEHAT